MNTLLDLMDTPIASDADPGQAKRLVRLLDRVEALRSDGRQRGLAEIAGECGGSEASVSARLRELRKNGYTVDKAYKGNGVWLYRMKEGADG